MDSLYLNVFSICAMFYNIAICIKHLNCSALDTKVALYIMWDHSIITNNTYEYVENLGESGLKGYQVPHRRVNF
jgi:hypothetical protein